MAVVHPLDNTFWTDAHRYKDAEVNYYTNLSKLQNNVNPSSLLNASNSHKSKKNKKHDPNISVQVTISQITNVQNPSATANIETKDTGNASGGKKKRNKNKSKGGANAPESQCSLSAEIKKARQQLQNQLQNCDKSTSSPLADLVLKLEEDKLKLEKTVASLVDRLSALELTVSKLQGAKLAAASVPQKSTAPAPKAAAKKVEDDDDDVDLFGSESEGEDESAAKIREERLAAYAAKKSKKPVLIAKSNIIFDVKPWDDETDMKQLESVVRSIEQDGLLWGAAKLVPLAYGIHKLQISCVVEDDKVSVDEIQEKVETLGADFVQSVDIAAFNKI